MDDRGLHHESIDPRRSGQCLSRPGDRGLYTQQSGAERQLAVRNDASTLRFAYRDDLARSEPERI